LIRSGLFGCGRIGRVHADSIDVHPRAELAWVYDPIESAANEVAKRYGATIAPVVDFATECALSWSKGASLRLDKLSAHATKGPR
jgi:predicted dehydrogenase